ncbi:unnamed protein product [Bursaphelenchus okinawaensis]|uniref:Uncharacterized protein n=1 Tax=Bursaphelenchus okinawaensis TaxID=465554 RepID=A0A811KTE5_9BILA|nr:unnamed protein product [Bursaphelenchus okinawaensis]CAG9112286.1 unnamed protein product [Bursaphelenchus okinawaensis]
MEKPVFSKDVVKHGNVSDDSDNELEDYLKAVQTAEHLTEKQKKDACAMLNDYYKLNLKYKERLEMDTRIKIDKKKGFKKNGDRILFNNLKRIQEKIKEIEGKLEDLDIYFDFNVDEPEIRAVFYTSSSFEPLNEKINEYINNPNNVNKEGMLVTEKVVKKFLKDLKEEHGEDRMIKKGIPLNDGEELYVFVRQLMHSVSSYVHLHRVRVPFFERYNPGEAIDDYIEDAVKTIESNETKNLIKEVCMKKEEPASDEEKWADDLENEELLMKNKKEFASELLEGLLDDDKDIELDDLSIIDKDDDIVELEEDDDTHDGFGQTLNEGDVVIGDREVKKQEKEDLDLKLPSTSDKQVPTKRKRHHSKTDIVKRPVLDNFFKNSSNLDIVTLEDSDDDIICIS